MEIKRGFRILFFITLILWAFALAYPLNPDYDLWTRLIAGNCFLTGGKVMLNDIFSYTPTHIWLDHEWGSGVIFSLLEKYSKIININPLYIFSSFKSLMVFFIALLTFLAVKTENPKNSPPYQILYFVLSLSAANMVYASTVRSHMFTFLFFALWIFILETYRKNGNRLLLGILPVSMIFWGNIHGGCLSGLGLLLIYSVGEFLNRKNPFPYILTALVSFSVLFINPYGTEYVRFLFEAGTMNRPWITEWQSPFLTPLLNIKFILFFLFMMTIALIGGISAKFDIKNCDKTKFFTVFSTAMLGASFIKLTPFFVIASSVFMFDDVYKILNGNKTLSFLINPANKAVYAILILLSLGTITLPQKQIPINLKKYPYMPVQFLKENKISGNLFTDMTYGSFCVYKLFPQNRIFMDGRYEEVYNPELLLTMKDFVMQTGENPDAVIKDFPTDIVLLNTPAVSLPAEKSLKRNNWKEIYSDNFWKIYVKPDYPIKDLKKPEFSPQKTLNTMFDTEINFKNDIEKTFFRTL